MTPIVDATLDRVEVVPGPGVVMRFGSVAIWVGPQASPDLLRFLGESARNLSASPSAGEEIADHLAGVLGKADPEPGVPFATFGRGPSGWAGLLHGPVQLWDGRMWVAPTPHQPWLRTAAIPSPMATVAPAGTLSHQLVSNPILQLEAGTVPGGGFTFLPSTPPAPLVAERTTTEVAPGTRAYVVSDPVEEAVQTGVPEPAVADSGVVEASPPPVEAPPAAAPPAAAPPVAAPPMAAPVPPPLPTPPSPPAVPPAIIDLSHPSALRGAPLGPVGDAQQVNPQAPVVAGVRCVHNHFNQPDVLVCVLCGVALAESDRKLLSGPRPSLGVVVVDDGSVFRLDGGYLIGSNPGLDPLVTGRSVRPLVLVAPDGAIAPSHCEIQLRNWEVIAVDRGSRAGTSALAPGQSEWARLPAHQATTLVSGTHLAVGPRVLTFVSPWPPART